MFIFDTVLRSTYFSINSSVNTNVEHVAPGYHTTNHRQGVDAMTGLGGEHGERHQVEEHETSDRSMENT